MRFTKNVWDVACVHIQIKRFFLFLFSISFSLFHSTNKFIFHQIFLFLIFIFYHNYIFLVVSDVINTILWLFVSFNLNLSEWTTRLDRKKLEQECQQNSKINKFVQNSRISVSAKIYKTTMRPQRQKEEILEKPQP